MLSLALTFDDGPDSRCTAGVLDLLKEAGARAIFFPIAGRGEAEPELITRMLADGPPEMFAATRPGLKAGAVVLAHDGLGPGALRDDARATLAYVSLVIEHAGRSGMALEALR